MKRLQGNLLALARDIAANKVVPFVGAGFSENADGEPVPSYGRMAAELFELLEPPRQVEISDPAGNPAVVFELLCDELGEPRLREMICEYASRARPGNAHRELVSICWPYLITTNYDFLIEDALREMERSVTICSTEAAIPNARAPGFQSDPITVVKLHGDCALPHGMVVRPSSLEYERFKSSHILLSSFLQDILMRWSALFIGYSLNDPHVLFIRKILEVLHQLAGVERKRDYVVLLNPHDDEAARWRNSSIIPVVLEFGRRTNPAKILEETLGALAQRVRSERKSQTETIAREHQCVAVKPVDDGSGLAPVRSESSDVAVSEHLARLVESRIPVVVTWTKDEFIDDWSQWMGRVACATGVHGVLLAYEQFGSDLERIAPMFSELLTAANTVAVVVDFAERIPALTAVKASQSVDAPTLAVAQSTSTIPGWPINVAAIYEYSLEMLNSGDASPLGGLFNQLGNFALSTPLKDCFVLMKGHQHNATVTQLGIVLETAIRKLTEMVADDESIEHPPRKLWAMVKFLEKRKNDYEYTLTRNDLKKAVGLRNNVVHRKHSAEAEEVQWMWSFVESFVRVNFGTNLSSFGRGSVR